MLEFYEDLLWLYLFLIILTALVSLKYLTDPENDRGVKCLKWSPVDWYTTTNVNIIGSIMLFILVTVINPVYALLRLIYFIFTFGRKE